MIISFNIFYYKSTALISLLLNPFVITTYTCPYSLQVMIQCGRLLGSLWSS